MRRVMCLASLLLMAPAANAQDTSQVVVRHLEPRQDTTVIVRRLAPPPERTAPARGAPRYALRSTAVYAKDPRFGTFLSFIFPGGGQYYADQPGKGLALTLLGIGAPIIGYAQVNHDYGGYYGCGMYGGGPYGGGYCHDHADYTPAAIGLGVGITAWLYGVATAGADVQRWNQAHGVRFMTAPGRMGFAVAVP